MENQDKKQPENEKDFSGGKAKKVKTHGQIHKPNRFFAALKATKGTKLYTDAEELLRERKYAESIAPVYQIVRYYLRIYPFLSVLTGSVVAWFLSELMTESFAETMRMIVAIVFFAVLLLLIIANEYGKTFAAEMYFLGNVTGYLSIVILTFFISAGISTAGGYMLNNRATTAQINDNIGTTARQRIDSLNNVYLPQIEAITKQNASLQKEAEKTPNKWLRHAINQNISNNNNMLSELREKQETAQNEARRTTTEEVAKTETAGRQTGYLISAVIIGLEILFLVLYFVYSNITKNIKTENRNENIVRPDAPPQATDRAFPDFDDLGRMILFNMLTKNGFTFNQEVEEKKESPKKLPEPVKNQIGFKTFSTVFSAADRTATERHITDPAEKKPTNKPPQNIQNNRDTQTASDEVKRVRFKFRKRMKRVRFSRLKRVRFSCDKSLKNKAKEHGTGAFQISKKRETGAFHSLNSFGTDICKNPACQKKFERQTRNQKYCSRKCRTENWKLNNKTQNTKKNETYK